MSEKCILSVRVPVEELQGILDYLDAYESYARNDLRRSLRRPYRCDRVFVRVLNGQAGADPRFQVTARNISAGGLAFLHGQLLLVDTRLRIEIPQVGKQIIRLVSRVVRCRHVRGMVHEVGAQFISMSDAPLPAFAARRGAHG